MLLPERKQTCISAKQKLTLSARAYIIMIIIIIIIITTTTTITTITTIIKQNQKIAQIRREHKEDLRHHNLQLALT